MKKTPTRTHSFLLLLALAFIIVVLLVSCELGSLVQSPEDTKVTDTVYKPIDEVTTAAATTAEGTASPATTSLPPPVTATPSVTTAASTSYHPLTGLPCLPQEATARPIAFCVKRASAAEIAETDLVIEAPTEGSTTRLSLIGTAHASLFGNLTVASTRPYLAALTHDFFGISIHRGTSDNGYVGTDLLYDTIDLSVNELEKSETALRAAIKAAGHQTETVGSISLPYQHSPLGETLIPDGSAASYASIPFGSGAVTTFTYDAARNAYTMRSCTAMEADGGTLPSFSSLLILFHDATRRITKDGTVLTLDTELGGYGYYLSAGHAMPILWQRDPATSSLRITDGDGIPLTVNRGKTYIGMTTYEHREDLILN